MTARDPLPSILDALTIEDMYSLIEGQEKTIKAVRGLTMKRLDDHRINPTQAAKYIAHVERVRDLLIALKDREFPSV